MRSFGDRGLLKQLRKQISFKGQDEWVKSLVLKLLFLSPKVLLSQVRKFKKSDILRLVRK